MKRRAAAWVLAGLVTVSLGLGGVAALGLATEEAAAAGQWRPRCARSMGAGYATLDVAAEDVAERPRVLLFGIDRSPSNAEQSDAQLDAAAAYVDAQPSDVSYGILFVSDRSDRSSTPDLPLEPAKTRRLAVADPLPCAPDCEPQSMFERACQAKMTDALDLRAQTKQAELDDEAAASASARAQRLESWRARAHAYWPEPGTSLLRFWHKVADLPAVRRDPESVTVVLMSDLEEARTRDRKAIRAFNRALQKNEGLCPVDVPVPTALTGVQVVLLQTVTDRVNADRWAETWETLLRCGGVNVKRYRYSPSIQLADYLGGLGGLHEAAE